jgi:hypothetical protein
MDRLARPEQATDGAFSGVDVSLPLGKEIWEPT